MIGAIVAGGLSAMTPPVTNSYESIETFTVGSGGQASITFNSIPSDYKHLQIRMIAMNTAGANGQYAQARVGNGSVDTGSNYAWHYLSGNGAVATAGASATQSFFRVFGNVGGSNSNSNPTVAVLDLLDYQNTNKYKTIRGLFGGDNNGAGGEVALNSSLWQSTSAINTVSIYAYSQGVASTFGQYSSFALYGIKG